MPGRDVRDSEESVVSASGDTAIPVIPDGSVLIFQMRPNTEPHLVETESCGERYGCHYIQFPERGRRCGGSSWSWPIECFREPTTPTEFLWKQQYLTMKRVIDLEADLVEAKANLEAVKRWAVLMEDVK